VQAQVAVADFDAGDAAEAVRGDGHAFDQVFLDGAVGFRVGVAALGEVQEVGGVIAREDGGFAREPMDGAVAAGARFAFGSAGPVDFCVMCRYSERRNDTGRHFRARA
jgi:hypothetical protein